MKTATEAGLVSCHQCHTICKKPELPKSRNFTKKFVTRCPCCGAPIHSRIPDSLSNTWALIIAAAILYIPANMLPIMNVTYFGQGQPDTIMGGIIHLIEGGMWPLAMVVFVASIVVPLLKLLVMTGLLISVHLRSSWRPIDRVRLFHLTEFVGRWSMVDILVVAILIALVQFGNIASVDAGLGALSFAAVVMLTMFAAHTFDPRLIWDAMDEKSQIKENIASNE